MWISSFPNIICLKRLPFPDQVILALLLRGVGCFRTLYFNLLVYISVFMTVLHHFRLLQWLSCKESAYISQDIARDQEKWVSSLRWEDPHEKEMAIHSSILAWEISWTEAGYSPWCYQSVQHDLACKQYHHFNYSSFVICFEIRKHEPSNIFLLCQNVLAIWSPFRFHVNFRRIFFSCKKFHYDFDKDYIKYANLWELYWHLNNIVF